MRNYLIIDGADSRDFGVFISGQGTYGSPVVSYNMLSVPGRDGDLIGAERRLQNIEVSYPAFIYTNFAENIKNLRNFLTSRDGYVKISDTYHSGEYRMGVYRGAFTPSVIRTNSAAEFTITFNCKPQRFLTSGDTAVANPSSLTNPTLFNARPLIVVNNGGAGEIAIGASTITLDTPTGEDVYIDCEMMDVYSESGINYNSAAVLTNHEFPVLHPGVNGIESDLDISITPRWYIV